MFFELCTEEASWESLGLQDQTSQSEKKPTLNIHWKDWCWSSNTLATWFKKVTHCKRPWCRERLKAKGERGDGGWDGYITNSMHTNLSKLSEILKDMEAWYPTVHGVANSQTWLGYWTTTKKLHCHILNPTNI